MTRLLPTQHTGTRRFEVHAVARFAVDTLMTWRERARQRRALRQLGPQHLRDIGVTSEEAEREAATPFWRA